MTVACHSFDVLPIPKSNKNPPTFTSHDALLHLRKCRSFNHMKQIHARIIRHTHHHHPILLSQLIRLSSSYGQLQYASLLIQEPHNPSTFSWNLLIRAHVVNGFSKRALVLYNLMVCRGGFGIVDKFTFPFVMKACVDCGSVDKAKEVYGFAAKTGFCGDVYLENVWMDLWFKCGEFEDGRRVFERMRGRNVVSWTTVVSGMVRNGRVDEARAVFYEMPVKNVVSWTAMIDGYAKGERPEKAFEVFAEMQSSGVRANEYTLVGLLVACAELGSLKLGRWVHDFVVKDGFEVGAFLGTALIDMYSKCGSVEDAKRVFEGLEDKKSVATWNAMITSLGVHGRGEEALGVFAEMERVSVVPDAITFVGVLCACLQTNDLEKGCKYFDEMIERYGIVPTAEHYDCLFELKSRAEKMYGPNSSSEFPVL